MPLGDALALARRPLFNAGELKALRLMALVLASITMSATSLVTLWFIRMRRSFRHDLIMLLIQSDMIKAIWFVVLPAVELARGPVESRSSLCQASGFFLAIAIEASDLAAVLVALHTALYIFRGRSGLYPYRRPAFAAFILVPLLLASLAFINRPAFVNVGLYCTMPARPYWTRHALSWVPRYFVFTTICAVYVSTYVYVRILMRRFGAAATRGESTAEVGLRGRRGGDGDGLGRRRTASAPPTPHIDYHGLIPATPPCETFPAERIDLQKLSLSLSLPSTSPAARAAAPSEPEQAVLARAPEQAARWNTARFGMDGLNQLETTSLSTPSLATADEDEQQPRPRPRALSSSSGLAGGPAPVPVPPAPSKSTWPLMRSCTTTVRAVGTSTASAPSETQSSSPFNPLSTLRRGTRGSDASSLSVFLSPASLGATDMDRTRDKIGRQLQQLFLYPAVYMFVWLSPFIAHIVDADDGESSSFGDRRSFVLTLASIASLSIQGIADALLFSVLEKPWRHPRSADDPPSSPARWLARCMPWWVGGNPADGGGGGGGGSSGRRVTTANVGRTREEMLVDSRVARRRRDQEIAERRLLQLAGRPAASPARDWWDVRLESVDESVEDDDDSVG